MRFLDSVKRLCNFNVGICPKCPSFSHFYLRFSKSAYLNWVKTVVRIFSTQSCHLSAFWVQHRGVTVTTLPLYAHNGREEAQHQKHLLFKLSSSDSHSCILHSSCFCSWSIFSVHLFLITILVNFKNSRSPSIEFRSLKWNPSIEFRSFKWNPTTTKIFFFKDSHL